MNCYCVVVNCLCCLDCHLKGAVVVAFAAAVDGLDERDDPFVVAVNDADSFGVTAAADDDSFDDGY